MKKAGIIRCQQTEDICPGTTDFKFAREGKGSFAATGPVEITAFVSCGGCPGKRAVVRAQEMVERGVEVIAMASCIKNGNPLCFPCPHAGAMKEAIVKKAGEKAVILDYTH